MKSITTRHLKAARALLGWNQQDLADSAGVSVTTVRRIEAKDGPVPDTNAAQQIVAALEDAGATFQNHNKPGVRLREK